MQYQSYSRSDGEGRGQGCSKIQYIIFGQPCPSLNSSSPPHSFNLCTRICEKPYHSLIAMLPKLRCKWGKGIKEVGGGLGTADVESLGSSKGFSKKNLNPTAQLSIR